jgi:tartrate dehydrogenase/decarboxylase / D-malate dehydrogenase
MHEYRIAVIGGDGIGPEVISEGIRVIDEVTHLLGSFSVEWTHLPWGCDYYLETGKMMPDNGLEVLRNFDAIYFGAVGAPTVPDNVSVWELILPIRHRFEQYVNYRPAKRLRGVPIPLRTNEDIDFVVVRENTEGEYANVGGLLHQSHPGELAIQTSVFTRSGVERVTRYALDLARSRRGHLTVATKSNAMNYSMPFWDRVVRDVAGEYPDVEVDLYHVDALTTYLVNRPHTLDVVLASNLFGDILTDLSAVLVGGLGIAPSANINPQRKYPSMFEPVHGSAPDIAGKGIANPIAAIWSGALMLEFLGEQEAANCIMAAVEQTLERGEASTPDFGGKSSTKDVGDAVHKYIKLSESYRISVYNSGPHLAGRETGNGKQRTSNIPE